MDCVIPGHSVAAFSASLGCLSRIGKDLYLEFDAIDGLALRSLNDAKSAYACFRYEPGYFEKCTAPPVASRKRQRRQQDDDDGSNSNNDLPSSQDRFSCRVALRALASVIRPRKGVVALRIRSETADASALFISFEFQVQNQDTLLTIVHRVKAADANGVSPVAPTDDASEIKSSPRVLLRLLEPLRNTAEAALIVRSGAQTVSASSFHHTDTTTAANNSNNAVLQAASASLLKTETAIGCDEFYDYDFHGNRAVDEDENIPEDVNEEVILVFPIKEGKAMLNFCSHAHMDEELHVTLNFHWGGRPLVFNSSTDSFSAELVLATLDYKMLMPLRGQADE